MATTGVLESRGPSREVYVEKWNIVPVTIVWKSHFSRALAANIVADEAVAWGYQGRSIRKLLTLCNVARLGFASGMAIEIHPSLRRMKVLSIFGLLLPS